MGTSRKKKTRHAKNQKAPKPDPVKSLEEMGELSGRVSGEDIAHAIGEQFAGPKGIALGLYDLAMDSSATVATRSKIYATLIGYIREVSKQYGDEAKLKNMPTEEIELRLCRLLVKNQMVVPIPGVNINVKQIKSEIQRQAVEAEGADRST